MTILSVGIVPIRQQKAQIEYLLLRCFKYWDFPKGELESGEDPLSTAVRELEEETSITQVKFQGENTFYETEIYSKGKIARYYLGTVDPDALVVLLPNPESGLVEHHEFRWVSFEEGLGLANPRIQKVFEWAHHQQKK